MTNCEASYYHFEPGDWIHSDTENDSTIFKAQNIRRGKVGYWDEGGVNVYVLFRALNIVELFFHIDSGE